MHAQLSPICDQSSRLLTFSSKVGLLRTTIVLHTHMITLYVRMFTPSICSAFTYMVDVVAITEYNDVCCHYEMLIMPDSPPSLRYTPINVDEPPCPNSRHSRSWFTYALELVYRWIRVCLRCVGSTPTPPLR